MRQTCVQGTGCATPVIADDDTIELNQGYLNYQGLANTNFRLGRQRIKLDNDRFIGNAGFRQNEQTFDAALVSHAPLPGLDLTYAFVDHVNPVFGDDARLGDFDSNTHLFNATHDGFGWGRITLYDYLIEVDDDAPAFSSNSTGLRLDGDHTFRYRGRDAGYPAPPAQIRTCPLRHPAPPLGWTDGESAVRPRVSDFQPGPMGSGQSRDVSPCGAVLLRPAA